MAFLGNMNNNHFALARFLRERGVECDVLIFEHEAPHFHPSADTYDLSFMSYCRALGWGNPARWEATSADLVRSELEPYNVVIGCGPAPAFCEKAGRRLDVFVPYGGDLAEFTRFRMVSPRRLVPIWKAVAAQRRGIPRCRVIQMDDTNALYEGLWERYRGTSERWRLGPPMVHTGTYGPERVADAVDRTHWAHAFQEVRDRSDLLVLYHARHEWGGDPSDPNQKGTDRLLEGFALFRDRNPSVRAHLVTLEYGTAVLRSKRLVAELGIEDSVVWFPRMFRKDLMVGVLHADVVCAEFEHSWLSSGVIYEALAMETPLMGYRDDALYRERYPRLYPLMNARRPEEVCERLEGWLGDPAGHREMGREGRRWYQEFVVEAALERYMAFLGGDGSGGGGR